MKTLGTLRRFDPLYDSRGAKIGNVQQINRDKLVLKFAAQDRPFNYILNDSAHDGLIALTLPAVTAAKLKLPEDRIFLNPAKVAA